MEVVRQLLTGPDNATLAVGRVLGVILFVAFVLFLPALIAGIYVLRQVEAKTWMQLLDALQVYVPCMVASAAGVIAGTAFTEPRAGPPKG